jgi:hypothetical protein
LSLSFMVSYETPAWISLVPRHMLHVPPTSSSSVVTLMTSGEQHKSWSFPIRNLFRSVGTSVHSTPLACVLSWEQVSHPNYAAGRIIVPHILTFIFLRRKTKNKIGTKW